MVEQHSPVVDMFEKCFVGKEREKQLELGIEESLSHYHPAERVEILQALTIAAFLQPIPRQARYHALTHIATQGNSVPILGEWRRGVPLMTKPMEGCQLCK